VAELTRLDQWCREQEAMCQRFQVERVEAPRLKVGVARNVRSGLVPLNGLRHPPQGDTTGWYLWAGDELCQEPDFFVPLHVEHLTEWCPGAMKVRLVGHPGNESIGCDPRTGC
jgi:hypothetical protein